MCHAQGPQRSDVSEARTRGPSVLSQALNHWATALPKISVYHNIYALLFKVFMIWHMHVYQGNRISLAEFNRDTYQLVD